MNVTSGDIKLALSQKHITEFFMTEVKSGSSMFSWHQIDAMAIYKCWTHQRIVGYEIKVSRSDFLRDNKMNTYLPYCHELAIVCPTGMIQPAEVPIEIGLMWFNPTTKKIVTKRKPIFRKIEISADMLYYIIMYRMQSDRYPFHSSKAEFFKDWLANCDTNRQLGREVSGKLPKEIFRLQDELDKYKNARDQIKLINDIKAVMAKHGMNTWYQSDIPKDLDKALGRGCPVDLDMSIRQLENVLAVLKKANIHEREVQP